MLRESNLPHLSIADTDDDGGFEEESSSSPNLGLKEATTGTDPLITPCPELRELRNAAYEDDSCDESEKDFAPCVEPSCTEPSPICTGTVCKTCKGRLHVWCAKFDPNSQETICTPCAEKDITIAPPDFVDSEASTPPPSVQSGHFVANEVDIGEENCEGIAEEDISKSPVELKKPKHEWRDRFNAVRKIVQCPKCPDHLQHRKPHFHITSSASGECISCKCLHCMKTLNPLTMSLAIKLAETEEKLEKALSARVSQEEPKSKKIDSITAHGTTEELKELMERTLNKVTVLEAQVRELRRPEKANSPWVNQKESSAWQKVLQAPQIPQERRKTRKWPAQEQAQPLRAQSSLAAQEVNWSPSPKQFKDDRVLPQYTLKDRLQKKGMIKMRADVDPADVVPIYLRGLQRTSEKALVEELRIGMDDPENAVMNVSFIGGSVVEVLTNKKCTSSTLMDLKEAGVTHMKDFNIFGDSIKKHNGLTDWERRVRNLNAVLHRTRRCARLPIRPAAKAWYRLQAEKGSRANREGEQEERPRGSDASGNCVCPSKIGAEA